MERRELATYALALGAHALVIAWAASPALVVRSVPPPVAVDAEIAIDEEMRAENIELAAPLRAAIPDARMAERATPSVATTAAAPSASVATTEEVAGSNGTWIVFGPSLGIGAPGQTNPFVTRAGSGETDAGAPNSPDAKRRSDGTLAAALRAQDFAKGLGPEGPILRALEEATLASAAPIKGGATFKAIVDATGLVVDLRLVAWRGEQRGWDDTRERAALALASKKMLLRGGQGAELQIQVDSDLRLPSGTTTKDLSQKRTVFSLDPSDVGARPQRVVHARLESFKLL